MLNRTLELFRRTGAAFTKFPVLWLPLLAADPLRSLGQWHSRPLTRAVLVALAPKSALGGGIAGLPSPATISFVASTVSYLVTVLGLFLYLYALGITARSLRPNGRQLAGPLEWTLPAGLSAAWARAAGLALVFVLFSAGFVNGILLPAASRARLKITSVQVLLWLCVLPVLAAILYLAIGFLRRYVLLQQDDEGSAEGPRMPYFLLLLACAVVSNLAAVAIGLLTGRVPLAPSFALLLMQVVASLVTSFPYAYAIIGLSLWLPPGDAESGLD